MILIIKFLSALAKPQVFQYYWSTKYTYAGRGGKKMSNKMPNGMNTFDMNPRPPKGQTTLANANFYNMPNSGNTAFTSTNTKPLKTLQPIHFGNFDANRLNGNIKNGIGTSAKMQEGSFCRRSFDGKSGYCVLAYNCLHAVRNYRVHRSKLDLCSYRQNVPIICCPLLDKLVEVKSLSGRSEYILIVVH